MSQRPIKAPSAGTAKMGRAGRAVAKAERSRFAMLWVVGLSLAAAAAIFGFFELPPVLTSAPTTEASILNPDRNRVADIVVQQETGDCEHRSFDNHTGRITNEAGPCPGGVVLDAKGMPVPTGTIKTMSSISKSFK
jgi:hypothetical protein